jgi:hypothetical protein
MKKNRLLSICIIAVTLFFFSDVFGQQHMMERGYGYRGTGQAHQGPINKEQAIKIVGIYLKELDNPNLHQGKVEDKGNVFLVDIVTEEGSLVDQVKLDKNTGRFYYRYGLAPGMKGSRYGEGSRSDWNYCPYCGRDLHHRGNYGMEGPMMHHGPGMMGSDYGYHHRFRQFRNPLDVDTAKDILNDYLDSLRNPNLKMGEIKKKDSVFEVKILTKKNEDLVDIISVDKYTGRIQSVY